MNIRIVVETEADGKTIRKEINLNNNYTHTSRAALKRRARKDGEAALNAVLGKP